MDGSRGKAICMSTEAVENAKDCLLAKAKQDEEIPKGFFTSELILAKGVSPQLFKQWHQRHESRQWGVKIVYQRGNIIATELVSAAHADAVGRIISQLSRQDINENLVFAPKHDCESPFHDNVESDLLIKVEGSFGGLDHLDAIYGNSYPAAVVEVGVSQSGLDLHRRLVDVYQYIPSLEYYVAIKKYANGGMVAMVFEKAQNWAPTQLVSFGVEKLHYTILEYAHQQRWNVAFRGLGFVDPTAVSDPPCNACGIAIYQIDLHVPVLFSNRVGGIPVGVPGVEFYRIDLFPLQEKLLQ